MSDSVIIKWRHLGLRTKGHSYGPFRSQRERIILNELSGEVGSGRMLCVLGGRGSGKSAFLNLLHGLLPSKTVQVGAVSTDKITSHVPQDTGYLDPELQVIEYLEYIATLLKVEDVERVLKIMSIEHLNETFIECLSTVEMKRLAIAVELLQNPAVLLLDEPTTGLDSREAYELVKDLYQMAIIEGTTIIAALHRPRLSVLSKFDTLMLLSNGQCIYFGPTTDALEYFRIQGFICPDTENPADYFIRILANEEHCKKLRMESNRSDEQLELTSKNKLLPSSNMRVVYRRYLKSLFRRKRYWIGTNLLIILPCALCVFIFFQLTDEGYAAVQNRIGFLSFVCAGSVILNIVIVTFYENLESIRRERSKRTRASSFLWAFIVLQVPVWLITMAIVLIAGYYITGLRYTPFTAFLIFMGICLLSTLQSLAAGVFLASITPNLSIALTASLFYILLASLFNGVIANTDNITWILRWIRYLSPYYYVASGLMQNEFDGQTLFGQPGIFWLNLYALRDVSIMWCSGALMIILSVTFVASQAAFERKTRPQ